MAPALQTSSCFLGPWHCIGQDPAHRATVMMCQCGSQTCTGLWLHSGAILFSECLQVPSIGAPATVLQALWTQELGLWRGIVLGSPPLAPHPGPHPWPPPLHGPHPLHLDGSSIFRTGLPGSILTHPSCSQSALSKIQKVKSKTQKPNHPVSATPGPTALNLPVRAWKPHS